MPIAHHNGKSIFFAHVPKTGGSSVEDYLIRRFGPLSLIDKNKRIGKSRTGFIVPATHLAAVDLRELVPPDLAYRFTVVRNPTDRIMSEYRYQTKVSRMSKLSFPTWLRVMLIAAEKEPRLYENHIRPQSDLVPSKCNVFRLEDGFDGLIERLDKITDTKRPDLSVGHLNIRAKKAITLSREDQELLNRFYAADYERFNYTPPVTSDLPSDPKAEWRRLCAEPLARLLVAKQHRDWVR